MADSDWGIRRLHAHQIGWDIGVTITDTAGKSLTSWGKLVAFDNERGIATVNFPFSQPFDGIREVVYHLISQVAPPKDFQGENTW